MNAREVIDKVSFLYREEIKSLSRLRGEADAIKTTLKEAEETHGKNITLAEYNSLNMRKELLEKEIESKIHYCNGISCVRELLMDLSLETKIHF